MFGTRLLQCADRGACMRHTTARQSDRPAETALTAAPSAPIRLLVTNPWNGQAYCVLRALRPHAARVIATVYREHGVLGRLAPAAVSRFVDPLAGLTWYASHLRGPKRMPR
jgi:hypothetical protein